MFGAGGIAPDIDIELLPMPWVVQVQERMAMYFKFAVKIRPALEASGAKIDANWAVPDSLLLQFKKYCEQDTNYTKVKSNALVTLDILKETILKEQQYMGDSSKTISDTMLAKRFSELNKVLELQRSLQFEQNKQYIKDGIKRELLTAIAGDSVSTAFMLKSDVQVKEAIKYLSNQKLYEQAIKPAKTKKNNTANSKKK
jgi:carboxyl-terminal processing protease